MKIKKFAAILLAVILTLALTVPAFAAVTPGDYNSYVKYETTTGGTITIVPSENEDLSGTSFVAYKVFNLVGVYGSGSATHYAYDLEPAFKGLFATLLGKNVADVTPEAAKHYVEGQTTAAQLSQFGKDVSTYASTYSGSDLLTCSGTASTGSYIFTAAQLGGAGLYVIADKTSATSTYNPMAYAVVTNYNDVTITRKGITPTLEKSITGTADADNDGIPDYAEAASRMIGATIPFQLKSAVPNMTGIASYTFKFTDTLSSGLTYNNNLVVKIGDTLLAESTDYTASCTGNVLTIIFKTDAAKWKAAIVGTPIVATYSATINSNAITVDKENNTAKVTYTNNSGSDHDSTPSKVVISELNFTVNKINEAETSLQGAEFALYTTVDNTGAKPAYSGAVKFSLDTTDGVYYVDSNGSTVLTSDNAGHVKINGLEAGAYYLVETKAPAGYNLLTSDVTVTVKTRLKDLDQDGAADDIEYYAVIDGEEVAYTTVINTTGVILPATGGIGTTLFQVGGVAIILLAGVFLVINRKKVFGSSK